MSTVHDEFVALGGKRIGAAFNQLGFARKVLPTMKLGKADLGAGYCAGIALDWARRVLQSGPDRDASYLSYSTDRSPGRQMATVKRMVKAYENSTQTYLKKTSKEISIEALQRLLNAVEQPDPVFGMGVGIPQWLARHFAQLWNIGTHIFARFDLSQDPSGRLTHTSIRALIDNLEKREDSQLQADSAAQRWADIAPTLDREFRSIRLGESRQVTKKPFDNLKVVRSGFATEYQSATQCLGELAKNGLQVKKCTVLTFKPRGEVGHAIAIYQAKAEEFQFFDPTFGTYRFASLKDLLLCIKHLFWESVLNPPVADATTLDRQKAVYCRRDHSTDEAIPAHTKMSYTMFEGPARE
jgi:hypothetical protein